MAFFGVTNCGYQNPIGDRMFSKTSNTQDRERVPELPPIHPTRRPSCTDTCSIYNQPLPYSIDLHRGSQMIYREMLRRAQTPRSPNQLYVMPVTDAQHYGWWLPSNEQWTRTRRFPRKHSEMTKFVMEMSMTDHEFSLF
ncbi:hypothetical protein AALO_G00048140 [Alosa alosa]|uniref:Testis-expressed protein 49 n=1 Tax=Alosa alosa TaxID=278164 RepID=A0AAV6H6Z2_9TELE|nr:testis-expressed protein 49-like [Alosa alosa]KAG5281727.1 hypothetical protein AALO_G00048140 [Alosa alosa]